MSPASAAERAGSFFFSAISSHLVFDDPVLDGEEVPLDLAGLAAVYEPQDLDGDERRQGDKGDAAERLRHDRAGREHAARADGEREHECRDHRAACDPARIEGDARKERRREKGEKERNGIARDEDPHDADPRQNARHGKPQRDAHADTQPLHHGRGGDRAGAHALDLFVENVYGGLCGDDEISDDHTDGYEQPAVPKFCKPLPDRSADGHEADVRARQEEHEPDERIDKPDDDADDLLFAEGARHELEEQEKGKDGRKRNGDFLGIASEAFEIGKERLARVADLPERLDDVLDVMKIEHDPEDEHGDDGSHAGERDETEGIVLASAAADGSDADAERHDEGHRHGARRHAARVKGDRPEARIDKDAEDKRRNIEYDEQDMQRDMEHDAEHSDREKDPDADADGQNEQIVAERRFFRDRGDLLRKDLQIGFRDRHDDADDKGEQGDEPYLPRMRHGRADLFTDHEHGEIGAQHKAAQSHDEQEYPHQKEHERPRGERNERHADDENDECNGKDGGERLKYLVFECLGHSYFIYLSSIAEILSILRMCLPSSENGVSRKVFTISSPMLTPIMPPPNASTLALLCSLVIFADSGSEQSAQRTPFTLLAAMEMPIPVVQTTTPNAHSPEATASAALTPKSG